MQQLSFIVEPVAKDGRSFIRMTAMSGGTIIINNFHLSSVEANAGQQQLSRLIEAQPLPRSGTQHDQVLRLQQTRDDRAARPGDSGIIDRFSARPVKVRSSSDSIKAEMIDRSDNPYKKLFVVDVDVSFLGEKPVLYRVIEVKECFDRSEAGL